MTDEYFFFSPCSSEEDEEGKDEDEMVETYQVKIKDFNKN